MLWQVFRQFPGGRTPSLGCVCAEAPRCPRVLCAGLGPEALAVSPGGSERGAGGQPPPPAFLGTPWQSRPKQRWGPGAADPTGAGGAVPAGVAGREATARRQCSGCAPLVLY